LELEDGRVPVYDSLESFDMVLLGRNLQLAAQLITMDRCDISLFTPPGMSESFDLQYEKESSEKPMSYGSTAAHTWL
jgi:hypothetical protein